MKKYFYKINLQLVITLILMFVFSLTRIIDINTNIFLYIGTQTAYILLLIAFVLSLFYDAKRKNHH